MTAFLLPELPGSPITIRRWLVTPGAQVTAGAPLVIVVTNTIEAVLPAPGDGVLAMVAVAAGKVAEAGTVLASLEGAAPQRVRATPLARVIAATHGIDLATISGSGPAGRINAADLPVNRHRPLEAQQARQPDEPAAIELQPAQGPLFTAMPRIFGANPAVRLGDKPLPLATVMIEADLSSVLGLIAEQQPAFTRRRLELGLATCLAWAVAAVLPQHPYVNAHWSADGMILRRRQHLAVAIPGVGGKQAWRLICDAGDLNLRGMARALGGAAMANPPSAATFSIIDGSAMAHKYAAYPPAGDHIAGLTVSAAQQRAIAIEDKLAIRPIAQLGLCYDARGCEHQQAIAFLNAVHTSLERMAMV
ncbi:MAG: hypothetical protein HC822_03200 [Oscillochloris sp.]|nr:hypothetical protein [Oscillochloris sp.]